MVGRSLPYSDVFIPLLGLPSVPRAGIARDRALAIARAIDLNNKLDFKIQNKDKEENENEDQ